MAVRLTVTRSGPPKKKRDNPEQRLAIAVADFLDAVLPRSSVWWHTPNSIWTTVKQAGVHKAMGVKAGVADCIIVWNGRVYAIELKAGRGEQSAAQDYWSNDFHFAGGKYAVCRSLEDVADQLLEWEIPALPSSLISTSAGSRRAA